MIINEYYQDDDSYSWQKAEEDFRILNLDNSIALSYGVSGDETYSKYQEITLKDSRKNHNKFQAINACVQSYSSFQEFEILKNLSDLKSDLVMPGFCMCDLTEPFKVKKICWLGIGYRRVTQAANKFLSFLLNETGFGRLNEGKNEIEAV